MDEVQDPHILDPDPFEGKIKAVSASNNYSCAVTVDGTVYSIERTIMFRFSLGAVENSVD
jgi:alpha-tubulin suppressor-like RCC1 family protein